MDVVKRVAVCVTLALLPMSVLAYSTHDAVAGDICCNEVWCEGGPTNCAHVVNPSEGRDVACYKNAPLTCGVTF